LLNIFKSNLKYYCPNEEAARGIIVVACLVSNDEITPLYDITMWIFDCVLDCVIACVLGFLLIVVCIVLY
jgi:hypothetical protein